MKEWYNITDIDQIDTPALVIFPQRVKHNLTVLTTQIDNVKRLRPHVKTHKCKEAVLLSMAAGINKFKCATIAEAEMLGMCNAPDALLAYQPVGPKLSRFINLIKHYPLTKYSCLVDNLPAARHINELAKANGLTIDVYIDLNIGMNRSGIAPVDALKLYRACTLLSNIRLIGLHAYDGHIHEADLTIRTRQCNEAFEPVAELISQLKTDGFDPVVIAGGTPTFPIHAKRPGIECSPGTFIYWDAGYERNCAEQHFLSAALVISRIISLPDETKVCLDLGHKSVASENVLDKRVVFLNAPDAKAISQSEEHLVMDVGANHRHKVGDVWYGVPYHICPTVALYERAIIIENNQSAGEWKTIARDRKINF